MTRNLAYIYVNLDLCEVAYKLVPVMKVIQRRIRVKGLIDRGYLLFEVNTKYISLSVLKTSEFSRVCSASESYDVFNSGDEIFLVFTK